jgi:hypothetical protein
MTKHARKVAEWMPDPQKKAAAETSRTLCATVLREVRDMDDQMAALVMGNLITSLKGYRDLRKAAL